MKLIIDIVMGALFGASIAGNFIFWRKLRAKTTEFDALKGRYDDLYDVTDRIQKTREESRKKTIEIEFLPKTKELKELDIMIRIPDRAFEGVGYICGGTLRTSDQVIREYMSKEIMKEIERNIQYKKSDSILTQENVYLAKMNYCFWGDE
jgi:hypothetical protein